MNDMSKVAMVIGSLLIVLALIGFVAGGADWAAKTALIPAVFGVPIFLCGLIGTRGPTARKHAMHVAAAVALLGALAVVPPLFIRVLPGKASGLAIASVVGEFLLCASFVALAVRSFIAARKAREAAVPGFEVQP